jgi:hypothetical protein
MLTLPAQVITAATADDWDWATLRKEQLDGDIGLILWEMYAIEDPRWKDTADRNHICKSYWAQKRSLVIREGILDHHSQPR